MSEMVERVAFAMFLSRYPETGGPEPESRTFWPDRLDELVSGPPFNADGHREMARAAIEAMRGELEKRGLASQFSEDKQALFCAAEELADELQST